MEKGQCYSLLQKGSTRGTTSQSASPSSLALEVITKPVKQKTVIKVVSLDTKGKSCLTDLMAFCDGMAGWAGEGAVNVICLGCRIFDTVSYNILVGKLRRCA